MKHILRLGQMLLMVSFLLSQLCIGDELFTRENRIKSAMIYNLIDFVSWPKADYGQFFNICIIGGDPLASSLALLQGKQTSKGIINVIDVTQSAALDQCLILYFSLSSLASYRPETPVSGRALTRLPNKLATLDIPSILTISDDHSFADNGGMISFVNVDNKVKLKINLATMKNEQLAISSQILKIAILVEDNNGRP
jgi:hypothetical protein